METCLSSLGGCLEASTNWANSSSCSARLSRRSTASSTTVSEHSTLHLKLARGQGPGSWRLEAGHLEEAEDARLLPREGTPKDTAVARFLFFFSLGAACSGTGEGESGWSSHEIALHSLHNQSDDIPEHYYLLEA